MTPKEIRKWYQDNNIPYLAEDWGARSDNGESADQQLAEADGDKHRRNRAVNFAWFNDDANIMWHGERTPEERDLMESLEAFFDPYIAMLPRPKGELVRQFMNDQLTLAEMGTRTGGTTRQNAHARLRVALQALARVVAHDDPDWYRDHKTERPRNHEAERVAAGNVLLRYLARRTG